MNANIDYSGGVHRLPEVCVRLEEKAGLYSATPLDSTDNAVEVMKDFMSTLDREYVCVVNLDSKLRAINFSVVSIGDISSSMIPTVNVFKSAILSNAASVMVLHNHPSGDIAPSSEDEKVTKRIVKAGKLLDVPVIDHIIVGGRTGEIYSFLQSQPKLVRENTTDYNSISSVSERKTPHDKMQDTLRDLEAGVREFMQSGKYTEYLTVMSKFTNYSLNNSILIAMQRPGATHVAGYRAWQQKFSRQVRKGEKGIHIISPCTYKKKVEVTDNSGEKKIETKIVQGFKLATVFDISQTEGEPLPDIATELTGSVELYDDLMVAIKDISPVPICFDRIPGSVKGYYSDSAGEIVIKVGMDQMQTIKTACHEMAHCLLSAEDKSAKRDRRTREVEAESTAYVVCAHYGLDTSDYSFPYVSSWSTDKNTKELKASLETIRKTSSTMISGIDQKLSLLQAQRLEQQKTLSVSADSKIKLYTESPKRHR